MATFITLSRWTQKGIENLKESPARLDRSKELFASQGAEVKAFYMVTGRYDMVTVIEAPDYETVAKLTLSTGSKGTIRTEILGAFSEEEYRRIIAALP